MYKSNHKDIAKLGVVLAIILAFCLSSISDAGPKNKKRTAAHCARSMGELASDGRKQGNRKPKPQKAEKKPLKWLLSTLALGGSVAAIIWMTSDSDDELKTAGESKDINPLRPFNFKQTDPKAFQTPFSESYVATDTIEKMAKIKDLKTFIETVREYGVRVVVIDMHNDTDKNSPVMDLNGDISSENLKRVESFARAHTEKGHAIDPSFKCDTFFLAAENEFMTIDGTKYERAFPGEAMIIIDADYINRPSMVYSLNHEFLHTQYELQYPDWQKQGVIARKQLYLQKKFKSLAGKFPQGRFDINDSNVEDYRNLAHNIVGSAQIHLMGPTETVVRELDVIFAQLENQDIYGLSYEEQTDAWGYLIQNVSWLNQTEMKVEQDPNLASVYGNYHLLGDRERADIDSLQNYRNRIGKIREKANAYIWSAQYEPYWEDTLDPDIYQQVLQRK